MNPNDKIYIAGHRGLVGSALVRRLTNPTPLSGGSHPSPSPTCGGGWEGELSATLHRLLAHPGYFQNNRATENKTTNLRASSAKPMNIRKKRKR